MNTTKQSPAWARAWERFAAGYGDEPDLSDEMDRGPFLQLLEEEVRSEIEAEIVGALRSATARMERIGEEARR